MSLTARVAIMVSVLGDGRIADTLESCVTQTLQEIEIVCVGDVSTSGARDIVETYARRDPRVRVLRPRAEEPTVQARRGLELVTAPFVLRLDAGDVLLPQAAEKALVTARSTGADILGLAGQETALASGAVVGDRHRHAVVRGSLTGDAVLREMFRPGKGAQVLCRRHLVDVELLREAFSRIPDDLEPDRVSDLPVVLLVAAAAERYASVRGALYRCGGCQGRGRDENSDERWFEFDLGAIGSVAAIESAVRSIADLKADPAPLLEAYADVRLAMIGDTLRDLVAWEPSDVTRRLDLLQATTSPVEVVRAAVRYAPEAVVVLARHGRRVELGIRPVRSVLLTTRTLTTGGVSGVLISQARYLVAAGYRVTVAVHVEGSSVADLPSEVAVKVLPGGGLAQRLDAWAELCLAEAVDVVIDHSVLYGREWHAYALMARALAVPTIGWLHNFSLRPMYDADDTISFLTERLNALATLVTLSPLDVTFWKLRGVSQVAYLPNPASPMLLESTDAVTVKEAPTGRARLIWWGRFDQHTKQVLLLLDVATELRALDFDFDLTIVGSSWRGFTARDLVAAVEDRNLAGHVRVVGPRHGDALKETIDAADLFVSTSIIEGYQLTLAEAQSRGLPVVMCEMPWLVLVQANDGIVAARQGDARALARKIVSVCSDPRRYAELSAGSLVAAERVRSHDFGKLYEQLVTGDLPAEFSPEPTVADARQLIDWMVFYGERAFTRASRRHAAIESFFRRGFQAAMPFAERVFRRAPGLRPIAVRVGRALVRGR